MSLKPPAPHGSLFAQVLALVLLSLIAAGAVNLGILFLVPPPAPDIYRISEVAEALKTGTGQVKARNGHVLKAALMPAPPAHPEIDRNGRIQRLLTRDLAILMEAPLDKVRLEYLYVPIGGANLHIRQMRDQFGPPPPLPPLPGRRAQAPGEDGPAHRHGTEILSDHPGDHFIVAPFEAAYQRADGQWAVVQSARVGLLSDWQQRVLIWFALSALALIPAAWLFARRLSAPIAAFAAAAERLGRDPNAPSFAIRGPAEVEVATRAFNEMQERLRRYVQDRTSMIGAVAHDLRTPLTRLRFRVEGAPEPLRLKMAADIDQMEAMIAATLAFVRDATQPTERKRLELLSLVESVADEMAETGLDVQASGDQQVVIDGDPVALRRLVTNLIDNAVKFGGNARARVYSEDGAAVVEIDDDGPGIPPAEQEAVFEPFYRGEPSRSRDTGGAGLGLAVVRSIARAHGGDASLGNRPEGGLRVRARLPL